MTQLKKKNGQKNLNRHFPKEDIQMANNRDIADKYGLSLSDIEKRLADRKPRDGGAKESE